MLKKIMNQKGITGLETAIILIAFVVVAAVFAYTTLSAGLFSTQKSQEAVYSGLKTAQSTIELKSGIIAHSSSTGADGTVNQITFIVSGVLNGEPIAFTPPAAENSTTGIAAADSNNTVVISYTDQYQSVNDLYWTITKLGSANNTDLLENSEKFEVTVGGDSSTSGAGNLVNALSVHPLSVNTQFDLSITPPTGAVLDLERTTPAWIDTIMNLR